MNRGAIGVVLLLATLQWGGCAQEHTRSVDDSSGSNWLRCKELADCSEASEAVVCRSDGFCVDARGERIAVRASQDGGVADPEGGRDAQEPQLLEGRDAQTSPRCPWNVDDALREVPATVPDRRNCGLYWSDLGQPTLGGALACYDRALAADASVQISFNRCNDCWIRTTYVASASGEYFEVTLEDDGFGDAQRSVTVNSCDALVEDEIMGLTCAEPVTRYACDEPRTVTRAPPVDPPVEPFKLADVPATGTSTVLHLYVSNQSFEEPLVDVAVSIGGVQVVVGDFAVEGQHNWYAFDIVVPIGATDLDAVTFREVDAVSFSQQIAVPAERWAVLDYWSDTGDGKGSRFVLNVSEVEVGFD